MFKKLYLVLFASVVVPKIQTQKINDTEFKVKNVRCTLVQTSILDLPVSAIVNAAKESCLGGGGIDGVITKAGGAPLATAREQLSGGDKRCPTGQARLTISGDIKNNGAHSIEYVLHAVGPDCRKQDPKSSPISEQNKQLIIDAYINTLRTIDDWNKQQNVEKHAEFANIPDKTKKIRSVAFPAISAGIYACDARESAPLILAAIQDYIMTHDVTFDHIYFANFNGRDGRNPDPSPQAQIYDIYLEEFKK